MGFHFPARSAAPLVRFAVANRFPMRRSLPRAIVVRASPDSSSERLSNRRPKRPRFALPIRVLIRAGLAA
jgi:hypothetical protein